MTGITGSSFLNQFFGKITIFLYEFQAQANIIVTIALLVVGVSLLSERGRQKIIPNLLAIGIGFILIYGAINLGASLGQDLAF